MTTTSRTMAMTCIIACSAALLSVERSASAQSAGSHERQIDVDGLVRRYHLYVPDDYDGSKPWPLVISYHGWKMSRSDQRLVDQLPRAADSLDFLVAHPQGRVTPSPFDTPASGWNFDGILAEHDDFEFTRKMIEDIGADYRVDSLRVHATGYSMGAWMTWGLACEMGDIFASVAGVAGPMLEGQMLTCAATKHRLAVMVTHGTNDPVVSINGVQSDGYIVLNPSFTAEFWANRNGCSMTPDSTELEDSVVGDFSTVTEFVYNDCEADVRYFRVNNGGHTWPGGGFFHETLGNINEDFDASLASLQFFERHPKLAVNSEILKLPTSQLEFDVFPNPSSGVVNIHLSLLEPEEVEVSLVNQIGQILWSRKVAPTEGERRITLETRRQGLASGLYFLQFRTDRQFAVRPVVVR